MDVITKKCEGCQLKVPSFGLPSEGKKRWCGACAKGHMGAVNSTKHRAPKATNAGWRRRQAGGSR